MILITGGMGFIGLHTAKCFLDAGEDVVLTQYRARREPDFIREHLGKRAHVESLDVSAEGALLDVGRRHHVTGIVHLAVPGLGALDPSEDYRVNMFGLLNVLDAARELGVKRLTYASSGGAYGSLPKGPFREDALLPVPSGSATEAFKKAWDILASHYADRSGLDVVSMRISGIYGPLYHSMANLPSRLCHAAVRGTEPNYEGARRAPFEEDEQDLCYVKDCARGIQLLQMADKLQHRIYNVAGGEAVTTRALVAAVKKAVPDAKIPVQPGRGPRWRENPSLDIARIREETGYEPQYDVERGVADYVDWLRTHAE